MQNKQIMLTMDGKNYLFEISLLAECDMADIPKHFETMANIELTMLPHQEDYSTAAYAKFGERKFFLIYMKPKRYKLLWRNKQTNEASSFIVWFPHLYLGVSFWNGSIQHGYALVSKKKILADSRGLDQKIGRLPLPNTAGMYGHICEGKTAEWIVTRDPSENVLSYAKYFMESEYVSDICDHWPYVPRLFWPPGWDLTKSINQDRWEELNELILANWQALSENNLEAVKNADWPEEVTIRNLISAEWSQVVSPENFQIVRQAVLGIQNP